MASLAAGNKNLDKAFHFYELGNTYLMRFQRLSILEDLDKAIRHYEQAVNLILNDHPNNPSLITALGSALFHRYQASADISYLEGAIKHYSQVVSFVPEDHTRTPFLLRSLGDLLASRFTKLGELPDLDKAIEYHTRAVSLIPGGHPDRPRLLADLGRLYRLRYERLGALSDLDTALALQNRAVLLTPDDNSGTLMQPSPITNTPITRSADFVTAPGLDGSLEHLNSTPNATSAHEFVPTHASLIGITSTMALEEIILRLGDSGCANITDQLDQTSYSKYPVSTGGFGDVYTGRLRDGRLVAIKTMRLRVNNSQESQKSLKHAAHELYTWSRCRHRHVQPLLGLVEFQGQIGMISVWEANGSLRVYLEVHPEADRCQMSTQIAEGLSYLHESGVIHGDLKGPNILISSDGMPLLADFGNSTLQEYTLKFTDTSTENQTTTRWAAPELIKGGTYSAPADVYALGMTILETITCTVPYADLKAEFAVAYAIIEKKHPERPQSYIPYNSEQGATLWLLLERCWAYEPADRPGAGQVKEMMQEITQGGLRPR
ncbi:hypothetical protein FRC08_009934 [Ceratobasidium sp. 394]|nr:hypothetical protein FRC08_009934 [Ceratobasidium sp. 394]